MRGKSSAKEIPAYVDGRLLRPVREVAQRTASRGLSVKEQSLRGFWGRWDQEINILRGKIDPLLQKIWDDTRYGHFHDDGGSGPFEFSDDLDLRF